jgi:phage terminase small subunit
LSKDYIVAELTRVRAEMSRRTEITADAVIAEMAKLGFANMADYMRAQPGGDPYLDFSALTRDQAAALQEVTVEDYVEGRGEDARAVKRVKFKLADKRAALVDLGRHLGVFKPDRIELSGPDGGPIDIADARQRNLNLIDAVAGRAAGAVTASDAPGTDGEADSS